jgi:hypothetical protein
MIDNTILNTKETSVDLADIIREGIADFTAKYGKMPAKHWKVINHITTCRTEEMGSHIYKCDNCGHKVIHHNSCRDRQCPKCQAVARADWVEKRIAEILPVGYFHIVFTVPEELNKFGLRNKKVFYNILFCSVSETLLELGKDPKWLGGNIGFTATLHTWGQAVLEHPHIHCVVPGGGIRLDDKKWVCFREKYIFPDDVLANLFRGKFIAYFKKAVECKEISLCGPLQCYQDRITFQKSIKALWSKKWVVYAKVPFGNAAQVIKYIGRYTHRIALSNNRILSHKEGKVTFSWKDYADGNRKKIMALNTIEFIRRFLLHILPEGFVRIRYYGFLSNSTKKSNLKKCFELLKKKYEKKHYNKSSIADRMKEIFGIDITVCPKCKKGHCLYYGEILKKPHRELLLAA